VLARDLLAGQILDPAVKSLLVKTMLTAVVRSIHAAALPSLDVNGPERLTRSVLEIFHIHR